MDSSSFPGEERNNDADTGNINPTPQSVNQGKRKENEETDASSSKPPKSPKTNAVAPMNTRSPMWEHFTKSATITNKCNCNYCDKLMSCITTSGTLNLHTHLLSCKQYKAFNDRPSQQNLNQEGAEGNLKLSKVSESVFREAVNEMLVLGELPLSFVESLAFRHFCNKVKLYKPHSRRTATRDIVELYTRKKEALRNMFMSTKQRVSLTTDIWTAPTTGASYMVITVHYVDSDWKLRKFIIGFKNISDHKGGTIATVLLDCLAEWGIERVFTITVDNATANTSALKKFKEAFKLVGNDALVLGGKFMHMRCAAHILNLIVKDGLQDVGESVEAIRNGVQYVRSSSLRLNSFELRVDSGKMSRGSLPMDIKTRWNSTYLMLTRAIQYKLAFEKMESEDKLYNDYFTENDNGKKRVGPPNSEDWKAVERLVRFLNLFYISTLEVSGSSRVCAHKCYNEIVSIELSLSDLSSDSDLHLSDRAYLMREKFNKYWEGLKEINKLLIVASVFDPTNKMQFANLCFENLYGKDSEASSQLAGSVEAVMRQLFEEYSGFYGKEQSGGQSSNTSQSMPSPQAQSSQDHGVSDYGPDKAALPVNNFGFRRMNLMHKNIVKEKGLKDASNELEVYLKEEVANPTVMMGTEFDVLSWWKVNSGRYPILSQIVKDVMAMQVSSVASESAFSTSGRILDPYRSCLTHYTIEVLMCTEQWLKDDLHFLAKGVATIQQMLAEVELQDTLQKEFVSAT